MIHSDIKQPRSGRQKKKDRREEKRLEMTEEVKEMGGEEDCYIEKRPRLSRFGNQFDSSSTTVSCLVIEEQSAARDFASCKAEIHVNWIHKVPSVPYTR